MKNLIVAAVACMGVLLVGYDCASAGERHAKQKTVPLKIVSRTTGFPVPNVPVELRDAETSFARQNRYSVLIAKYAKQNGVAVELATAVIRIESNFNPKTRGSAGEIGLMQIKPATAKLMGYTGRAQGLYDPETNIKFGMKYLAMAQDLGGGPTCNTILKYNAGHGATRMNPISKRYCGKVLALLD
ncbi:lytic transglycosylase domain-containing protein [Rhizobium sp. WW22]|jgi:soluble lytic murein transglycosylase-like protein|uniref:lytic transglycosylase domain-containing protein n=1 Tax=unclassified Rhizobium TaxID=2613769 RepID=UPI000DD9AAB0|nr:MULTISPECIES: transglycosylase SLT domain-containing protein [unclassified Rhizobium]MBB3381870.1 soluble lytic murein transglycosylase-like protein [Rhizobium sp. BK098]MBB3613572.1 soluble lytic murein transglycosylase-like protein [Rhizobium sp. BK609]MBB3679230.1 soluble lytic murein transglycosylase-like protein [Rhizobium sp. BK612]